MRGAVLRSVAGAAAVFVACVGVGGAQPVSRPAGTREQPPPRTTLRGTAYAIPQAYVEASFGSDGVALRADARTLAAWAPPPGPRFDPAEARRAFLAEGLMISVSAEGRLSGSVAAAQVANSKRQSFHEPGEAADELSAGGGPTPPGLRLSRALPPEQGRPARAVVRDMLVPDDAPPGYGLTPFGEAIFCTSPLALAVVSGMQTVGNLRCEHAFAHRDLVVELNYQRRHLPRWREMREGVRALLDRWAVGDAPPPAR